MLSILVLLITLESYICIPYNQPCGLVSTEPNTSYCVGTCPGEKFCSSRTEQTTAGEGFECKCMTSNESPYLICIRPAALPCYWDVDVINLATNPYHATSCIETCPFYADQGLMCCTRDMSATLTIRELTCKCKSSRGQTTCPRKDG